MKYTEKIESRINETLAVLEKVKDITEDIEAVAQIIVHAFKNGNKLIICGNGGSAADAQHIAAEFIGKFYKFERQALPAIALNTNTSSITAIANDFGYDLTYKRGVEAFGKSGDVLWAISTSGNSKNIIEAIKVAKSLGMKVVSLTGESGGEMAKISDITLKVKSSDTPIIQNVHIAISHIICEIVESQF